MALSSSGGIQVQTPRFPFILLHGRIRNDPVYDVTVLGNAFL